MRPPLIPALAVLLLISATGCSSSSSGSGSGSGSGAGGTAAGTPSPGSTGSAGSGGTGENGGTGSSARPDSTGSASPAVLFGADALPTPAANHCTTKHLTAVARTTGQGRASLLITNTGAGTCTLRGFPSLLFISENGRIELPVDWAGSAADAPEHALAPGESASAALTFTSLPECDPVTGLDAVPPGESRPLTPRFTTSSGKKQAVRICDTGVRVEAFTPSG